MTKHVFKLLLLITLVVAIRCDEKVAGPVATDPTGWVVDSSLVSEIVSKVDSVHIKYSIQTLQDFESRFAYSPQCFEAAKWISSQLESYGYHTEVQSFHRYLFNDVFFTDNANGWIVGNYGLILNSDDGGITWHKQLSPLNQSLKRVFFIDLNNGWIGSDSTLMRSTNSGENWAFVPGINGGEVFDIFFINELTGWVSTKSALYHTSDGGETWEIVYGKGSIGVYFLSESRGFLCLKNSLIKTIDGGLTWSEVFSTGSSSTQLEDIDFFNNETGLVVSEDGDIYLSKDGGDIWTRQILTGQPNLIGCNILSSNFFNIFSLTHILNTYDGGSSWGSYDSDNITGEIHSISFKNVEDGFAVGHNCFAVSKDSGKTWSEFPLGGMDESVLFHNINATKEGKIRREDRIKIGAHYDAISKSNAFLRAPGANDNASGVAAVMEMARVLREYDFDLTMDFILFSYEEPNPVLLGSENAAEKSLNDAENIVEMINLDMIGYSPDGIYDVQIHTPNAEHRADFISRASHYPNIIVHEDNDWIGDERSYGEKGFSALLVSEFTHESVWDYPWYHSSEDKIDKLNLSFTSEVTKFILWGICLKALPIIKQ